MEDKKHHANTPVSCKPLTRVTPHFYIVKLGFTGVFIFSSPELLGSQGELIVYPSSRRPSVVRPPFSKIFSSETAWPIKAKFMWSLLGKGERKFV